jgi:hypothetical protein
MGYRKISLNRYDIFRNGLVHHGLPKSENGGGVGLDEPPLHFLTRRKLNRVRGIHVHRNRECDVTLAVLLKEFEAPSGVEPLSLALLEALAYLRS